MKSAWSHTYFIPLHMANDLTESLLVNSCFSPSLLRYTLWNDNHNKVTYKHSLLLTITILSLLRWEHSKAALLSTCRYTIWYCALWSLYCTPAPQTYSSYSRKAVPFEQHLPYSLTPCLSTGDQQFTLHFYEFNFFRFHKISLSEIPFSITSSGVIHVAKGSISFFLMAEWYSFYCFLHSFIQW